MRVEAGAGGVPEEKDASGFGKVGEDGFEGLNSEVDTSHKALDEGHSGRVQLTEIELAVNEISREVSEFVNVK